MNRPGALTLATVGVLLIRRGLDKEFHAPLLTFALAAGGAWLILHPDQARSLRPAIQLTTIRVLHHSAAMLGRAAIQLETNYRASVAP